MSAKSLFSSDATVEYRAVPALDGGIQWHWVLFNTLDKVLGGGTAGSRGKASDKARRKARQLHRHIRAVRVVGLVVEDKKPIDVRDFITQTALYREIAERCGYKLTDDQFWAKASQNEPIYARKIEGVDYTYTISVWGGTGKAKGGGMLVWVALDFEDNGNHYRIALHTLLTTESALPRLLGHLELTVHSNGESWMDVDHAVRDFRKDNNGIVEAEDGDVGEAEGVLAASGKFRGEERFEVDALNDGVGQETLGE